MFRRGTYLCLFLLAACMVSCRKDDQTPETGRMRQAVDISYRVDQPDVTHHDHVYSDMVFQQYDEVTVQAGGCVTIWDPNAGLSRAFHYVHPHGYMDRGIGPPFNAVEHWHGLIQIPGATAGLEPIASVIARSPIYIRALPPGVDPSQLQLALGYDYVDSRNGYGPATISSDECIAEGPAWVVVNVTHHLQPPILPCPYPANPSSRMDMYWTAVDANMLPLNPMWGQQCFVGLYPAAGMFECNYFRLSTPDYQLLLGSPPCSTHLLTGNWTSRRGLPTCNPDDGIPSDALHGHANWGWATFTSGTIYYNDYSGGWPYDSDANAVYYADNRSVFTTNTHVFGSVTGLDLEFLQDETTDQMHSGWWNAFRQADDPTRRNMMNGQPAQVVGLLGIDVIHGNMELHPVLGMAVQIRSDAALNTWAVFARPWGNEGACGNSIVDSAINNYPPGDMRFMLPVSFTPAAITTRYFSEAYVDSSVPGAVLLRLRFPGPLNYGEIDIAPTCIQQCPPGQCGTPEPYGCGTCWTCTGTCCNTTCCPAGSYCCDDQCSPSPQCR